MALINCDECKKEVSDKAEVCPSCGFKIKAGGGLGRLIFLLVLLGVSIFIFSIIDSANRTVIDLTGEEVGSVPSSFESSPSSNIQSTVPVQQDWNYYSYSDDMTQELIYTAFIRSDNFVNFDSPYDGSQQGKLTARTHPRWGKDVYLSVERGQFLCRSYRACELSVVFDDGPVVKFDGIGDESGSSNIVFIKNYSRFMGKLLKAKEVRISIPVYSNGSPAFIFNIDGFSVAKYRKKS